MIWYVTLLKMKTDRLKFIVFSMIGVFNTLFDLALYVVIYNATNSIIIANIAATSAALIGSYFLNSRLTFKGKKWSGASFALFVAVTVFGLWVLQTGVIYILTPIIKHIPESAWRQLGSFEHTTKTILPKLIATGVTFVWNFIWYNKVIFKEDTHAEQAVIALD